MYIQFFNVPIDSGYTAVLDITYRATYLDTLRRHWTHSNTINFANFSPLAPRMRISTTRAALNATYCIIGDSVDADGRVTADGEFYFVESAQMVSATACTVELVSDLYHNYIRRDVAPPYIVDGTMARGHLAYDFPSQYAPYSLPAPVDPPASTSFKSLLTANGYIDQIDDSVFRIVATANVYASPARPPIHMVSDILPYRTCASIINEMFKLNPIRESKTQIVGDDAVSLSVKNYSRISIVPADLIKTRTLQGKWYCVTSGVNLAEFWTVNEADRRAYGESIIFSLDDIGYTAGDYVAVGTNAHLFPVPVNGTQLTLNVYTTYNLADGFRFSMMFGGQSVDITRDFEIPALANQASSYFTESQNEADITRGILGVITASAAVGGAIASGGTLAPVLVPTAVGAVGDIANIGLSRWQKSKEPFNLVGSGGGFDNAIRGGIVYIKEPAVNKPDILALIESRGVDFTYHMHNTYLNYPTPARGYTHMAFDDINLQVRAPSDIRRACNDIFLRGVTMYTDPTKLL